MFWIFTIQSLTVLLFKAISKGFCGERSPPSGPGCRPLRGLRAGLALGWRPGAGVSGWGAPWASPAVSVLAPFPPPRGCSSVRARQRGLRSLRAPNESPGSESLTSFPGDSVSLGVERGRVTPRDEVLEADACFLWTSPPGPLPWVVLLHSPSL